MPVVNGFWRVLCEEMGDVDLNSFFGMESLKITVVIA